MTSTKLHRNTAPREAPSKCRRPDTAALPVMLHCNAIDAPCSTQWSRRCFTSAPRRRGRLHCSTATAPPVELHCNGTTARWCSLTAPSGPVQTPSQHPVARRSFTAQGHHRRAAGSIVAPRQRRRRSFTATAPPRVGAPSRHRLPPSKSQHLMARRSFTGAAATSVCCDTAWRQRECRDAARGGDDGDGGCFVVCSTSGRHCSPPCGARELRHAARNDMWNWPALPLPCKSSRWQQPTRTDSFQIGRAHV